jgi:putative transferase (TIGR04331 family)
MVSIAIIDEVKVEWIPEVPVVALTRASNHALAGENPNVLAGHWCLREPEASASSIPYVPMVLPPHWGEASKRAEDYGLLSDFYEPFLLKLSSVLNNVHGMDEEVRYWEIVLGPWILTYISVLFDRWEIARMILGAYPRIKLGEMFANGGEFPRGYTDFVLGAADEDVMNQELLEKAIRAQAHPGQVVWRKMDPDLRQSAEQEILKEVSSSTSIRVLLTLPRRSLKALLTEVQRFIYSKKFLRFLQPQVLFIHSYFPRSFLLRLQLRIGQVPYPDLSPFPVAPRNQALAANRLRTRLEETVPLFSTEFTNPWEIHAWESLARWIPTSAVEDLGFYKDFASGHCTRTKVAVTSNAHWSDEGFKVWAAESVRRDMKLVIAEHGGGFPIKDFNFHWEERISDICVPSFGTYHPKHVRTPQPKYVQVQMRTAIEAAPAGRLRRAKGLLVVPFHGNRYTIRANSQIKSHQSVDSLHLTVTALNLLSDAVGNQVTIKTMNLPAPSQEMPIGDLFKAYSKRPVAVSVGPLEPALNAAKLILCTYPESAFAEALMSGVPVVLLYDANVNVSHAIAQHSIELLKQAGIIFNDPEKAARHIDSVWPCPEKWWESEEVVHARRTYLASKLVTESNPMESWAAMLLEEIS